MRGFRERTKRDSGFCCTESSAQGLVPRITILDPQVTMCPLLESSFSAIKPWAAPLCASSHKFDCFFCPRHNAITRNIKTSGRLQLHKLPLGKIQAQSQVFWSGGPELLLSKISLFSLSLTVSLSPYLSVSISIYVFPLSLLFCNLSLPLPLSHCLSLSLCLSSSLYLSVFLCLYHSIFSLSLCVSLISPSVHPSLVFLLSCPPCSLSLSPTCTLLSLNKKPPSCHKHWT